MGQEIVYCARCNTRLMSADLEAGRGRRVGNRFGCAECAPVMLRELPPEERDPTPVPSTSRRMRPRESTRRSRVPAAKRSPVPLIVGILVAVVIVVIIVVLSASSGAPTSAEPPSGEPVVDAPVGGGGEVTSGRDGPVRPADAERHRRAREVLDRALAETDPEARLKALRRAVHETAMTPHFKEAQQEYQGQRKRMGLSDEGPQPESPLERPWRSLFDGRSLDVLNPASHAAWKVDAGAIVSASGKSDAAQSAEMFSDGEIRFRFEFADCELAYFAVRQGGDGKWAVVFNAATIRGLGRGPHELLFMCAGDTVTATLDGRSVEVRLEGGRSRSGRMQFLGRGGTFRVLSVEYRPLSE